MKGSLLFLLFISTTIFVPQTHVFSANPSEYSFLMETTAIEMPLHVGADETFRVIDTIPNASMLIVLKSFINGHGDTWLKVKNNNIIGWIKYANLRPIDIRNYFFTSSSSKTPIRKGADSTDKVVGTLIRGEIVRALDSETHNGERWIRINHGQLNGWIPINELELFNGEVNYINQTFFASNKAEVRRGASFNEKITYSLKKGEQVQVLSILNNGKHIWYRIKTEQNNSGWLLSNNITRQINDASIYFTKNNGTHLYRGATHHYKIVASLSPGLQVRSSLKYINDQNELWHKVEIGNNKSGWIKATELATNIGKVAYLTIDDGPTIYTSKLLDILKNYNAKATFFLLDGKMKDFPNEVKKMNQYGHSIGAHSITHDVSRFYQSPQSAVNEMIITRGTIKNITGIHSNLMRVPYGSSPYMKKGYRVAMSQNDFIMWDWNIDSLDWKLKNADYVNHTLMQLDKLEKNGQTPYILIHDRKNTIDHLPKLLEALKNKGYTLLPITENMIPYQFLVE